MITLQHSLISLLALDGNIKEFEKQIPYILFPDAIRKYTGNRSYSHFETSTDGKDVSWIKFPKKISRVNQKQTDKLEKHLSNKLSNGIICEKTDLKTFERINKHLKAVPYAGIKKHLVQDDIFDEFIRDKIDMSKRREGKFYFQGNEMDGKEVRRLISEIENYGVYILACILYVKYGIITDQEWFDRHVGDVLKKEYKKELAEATYSYMKIPEEMNKLIKQHKGCELQKGILDFTEYLDMYKDVVKEMKKIDIEKSKKQKEEKEEYIEF